MCSFSEAAPLRPSVAQMSSGSSHIDMIWHKNVSTSTQDTCMCVCVCVWYYELWSDVVPISMAYF
jgi:hypothetical protein